MPVDSLLLSFHLLYRQRVRYVCILIEESPFGGLGGRPWPHVCCNRMYIYEYVKLATGETGERASVGVSRQADRQGETNWVQRPSTNKPIFTCHWNQTPLCCPCFCHSRFPGLILIFFSPLITFLLPLHLLPFLHPCIAVRLPLLFFSSSHHLFPSVLSSLLFPSSSIPRSSPILLLLSPLSFLRSHAYHSSHSSSLRSPSHLPIQSKCCYFTHFHRSIHFLLQSTLATLATTTFLVPPFISDRT